MSWQPIDGREEDGYPLWDDARGIFTFRTTGANAPNFALYRGNMRAWEFKSDKMYEAWLRIQYTHGIKSKSIPDLHVHFFHTSGVDDGSVVWQAEITLYKGRGQAKPLPVIIKAAPVPILAAEAYAELIADFGALDMLDWSDKGASAMLEFRLFRDPADPGDDSTATAWLDESDSHHLKIKPGSKIRFGDPVT